MEDSIATAPRDLLGIWTRKLEYLGLQGMGSYLSTDEIPDKSDSLYLYPGFEEVEEAADVLNRLGWYLPASAADRPTIAVADGTVLPDDVPETAVPTTQVDAGWDHLDLRVADDHRDGCRRADEILLWDTAAWIDRSVARRLGKTSLVDPGFYSDVEVSTWPRVSRRVLGDTAPAPADVGRILERAQNASEAYVFATGPSLDRVLEHDVPEDALTIVCNSIVRNDELLDHIDPDVLVFADPVFHFGPSRYAETFRRDAVETIRRHDALCVIPAQHWPLWASHHAALRDDTVALTVDGDADLVLPSSDDPRVAGTDNIMTLLMLPIAMATTDAITIVGADGREEGASYFWEHSSAAQYDDETMQTAVETHPSFFRDRKYTDYYEQHVATLTRYVEAAEERGIAVSSLTPSHVDCLQERYVGV